MKYRELSIQTQREAPNNARTEGFAFLVRAGYLTRENDLTPFGKYNSSSCILSATRNEIWFENILLALAETYHDEKGLAFPRSAAPFEVYLLNIPGKEMDTCAKAGEIHMSLQNEGISVLFDDRDERAGVKFNDADLIGCPVRLTVGEKNLKGGMVELKSRTAKENKVLSIDTIVDEFVPR